MDVQPREFFQQMPWNGAPIFGRRRELPALRASRRGDTAY